MNAPIEQALAIIEAQELTDVLTNAVMDENTRLKAELAAIKQGGQHALPQQLTDEWVGVRCVHPPFPKPPVT